MSKNKNNANILEDIKLLENEGYYHEALRICSDSKYFDNARIQSERLFILIKYLEDYTTAYHVFKRLSHVKEPFIQSKGVKILAYLKKYDELNKLIEENNSYEQLEVFSYVSSVLGYYYEIGNYEEIVNISSNPKYRKEPTAIKYKESAKAKIGHTIDENNDKYNEVLTKLFLEELTLEDINNIDASSFEKDILTIAYYERVNPKIGLDLIKRIKNNPELNSYQVKRLNIIREKLLSNKNRFFDIELYSDTLGVVFNRKEAFKAREEKEANLSLENINKKENEEFKKTVETFIKKEKEIKERKVVTNLKVKTQIPSNTRINRYNNPNSNNASVSINKEAIILIKNEYANIINYIGRYLYVRMQSTDVDVRNKAIKYWDSLEIEIEKPITDLEAIKNIEDAYKKIKEYENPSAIKIIK